MQSVAAPAGRVVLALVLAACAPMPRAAPPVVRQAVAAAPQWQVLGTSVEGRPIRCLRVGTGARQVLWIGGIHGDEVAGTTATEELPAALRAEPGLLSRVTVHVVEDANPDGRAASRRANARGVDLNRDFPAANRRRGAGLGEPESRVIHDLILRVQPDLVLVAHCWRGRYFVNFDGPARELAHEFSRRSGFPVVPSSSFAATPGSLGSFCGWDLGIAVLTIEWQLGTPPDEAWAATRDAILAAIRGRAPL